MGAAAAFLQTWDALSGLYGSHGRLLAGTRASGFPEQDGRAGGPSGITLRNLTDAAATEPSHASNLGVRTARCQSRTDGGVAFLALALGAAYRGFVCGLSPPQPLHRALAVVHPPRI
jgi:hypothetical protein